jgi:hypothetical protein
MAIERLMSISVIPLSLHFAASILSLPISAGKRQPTGSFCPYQRC